MSALPPVIKVQSTAGVQLAVREWKADMGDVTISRPVVVLVHPYSLMGGSEVLMRGLATSIRKRGYRYGYKGRIRILFLYRMCAFYVVAIYAIDFVERIRFTVSPI